MEPDLTQPHRPPRDTTQRVLRLVFNILGIPLTILLPLSLIAAFVAWFTLPNPITGDYLILACYGLFALFGLRMAIVGAILVRAPMRLSQKLLATVAKITSRPQRLGQLYIWAGAWLATNSIVWFAAYFPPPLPRAITPPTIAMMVTIPIVLIIAFGPIRVHRMHERRRARASR